MNRMADGVLKELDIQQQKEDQMIARYEREREAKLRRQEDEKVAKKKNDQGIMRATLKSQFEQKKAAEKEAKVDMNKQADMWKKEREIWQVEDQRLQNKIKKINMDQ